MRDFDRLIFLAVRDALYSRPHPDSKRQRKARDLTRYGARELKGSNVTCQSPVRLRKRAEIKAMRKRLEDERKELAKKVAARLLGRKDAA